MKKNLVIVRAGENSLHREWLSPGREWDIIVSGYGDAPPEEEEECIAHYFKGAKWNGIYDAIAANEDFVFSHERIMLPDDDLRMRAADINALFAIGEALDLRLYQPSLTGHFSWAHLNCRRDCLARWVGMVEIMTPVLHRDILRLLWRDFRQMRSGVGMDYYWQVFSGFPHTAVLDCVPVEHTRPIGSRQPDAAEDESTVNCLRRGFSLSGFAPWAGSFYGDIAAVKNDLSVSWIDGVPEIRSRKYRRLLIGERRHSLDFPRRKPARAENKNPRDAATTKLAEVFNEYAADKDFSVLSRNDCRPPLSAEKKSGGGITAMPAQNGQR